MSALKALGRPRRSQGDQDSFRLQQGHPEQRVTEKKTGAAVSLPEAEVMSGPEMLLAAGILTGLSRSFDSAGAAG